MLIQSLLLFALPLSSLAAPTEQPDIAFWDDDDSVPIVDFPDLGIFNISTIEARDENIEKRALDLVYTLYDVVFDGVGQANFQNFAVTGELMLIKRIPSPGTRNGANPIDVVVRIGNPSGSPVAGSIRYVTNRYLNPFIGGSRDTSRLDFARVSNSNTQVRVKVDSSIAAANQISVFNARSGLFAEVYNAGAGNLNLVRGSNGALTGRVNFAGRGLISGSRAPYIANIRGKAKQKGKTRL
ncbi:hypothetical protein CC79DRAFT_1396010 [Sarocladium strictum]